MYVTASLNIDLIILMIDPMTQVFSLDNLLSNYLSQPSCLTPDVKDLKFNYVALVEGGLTCGLKVTISLFTT